MLIWIIPFPNNKSKKTSLTSGTLYAIYAKWLENNLGQD